MQEQLLCLWVLGREASTAFTDSPCAQDVWMLQSLYRQSFHCTKSILLSKDKETACSCPASAPVLAKQLPSNFLSL